MSNPAHRPNNRTNQQTEQNNRIITELRKVVNNTDTSGDASSSLIKGLTDIDDTDTAKFIKVATSGALRTNDENITRTKNGNLDTLIPAVTIYGKEPVGGNLYPATMDTQGRLTFKNVNELLDEGKAQVYLNSAGGTSVKADSSCSITADPEFRKGWNMVNSTASTKFNLYIFNGSQETLTVGDISSLYFKGYINQFTGISSIPFLQIYTKQTGVGDAGAFYHSRISYVYNNTGHIGIGEEVIFYGEGVPSSQFSNRKIQLSNKLVQGDGEDTEEIFYIVCASDSSAPQNEMNSTINLIGFNTSNLKRNFQLIGRNLLDLTEDIKEDINTIDNKISKGDSDITDGNGLFQVLCYGKDQSGNLDPLNVDNNGHLKITLNDIEENIENSIKVSQPVERNNITVTNDSTGSALLGSLDINEFTETIDIDGFKIIYIDIDSSSSDSLELWTSDNSSSGFRKFEDIFNSTNGGIQHTNTNMIPRYLRIYNNNTSIYPFSYIKVFQAR